MVINGREAAKEILTKVREDIADLGHEPIVRAIVLQPSAATESYLSIKERRAREAGMYLELVRSRKQDDSSSFSLGV
jgi:5,10-methylene-tetrahydrofolate dehydrogenase/methenyl tetrahydrofolate cyclohydrolase